MSPGAVSTVDRILEDERAKRRKKARFRQVEAELQPVAPPQMAPSAAAVEPVGAAPAPLSSSLPTGAAPTTPRETLRKVEQLLQPSATPSVREMLSPQQQRVLGAGQQMMATAETVRGRYAQEKATQLAATPGGPSLGERQAAGIPGTREEAVPPLTRAVAPPSRGENPLGALEILDKPRQFVKENIIEPALPYTPMALTVDALKKIGVSDKIAGPLYGFVSGGPIGGLLGSLSEDQQAEALSYVLDPANVAFMPGKSLEAARVLVRATPKLGERLAVRLGESKLAQGLGEAVVRGEAGMLGKPARIPTPEELDDAGAILMKARTGEPVGPVVVMRGRGGPTATGRTGTFLTTNPVEASGFATVLRGGGRELPIGSRVTGYTFSAQNPLVVDQKKTAFKALQRLGAIPQNVPANIAEIEFDTLLATGARNQGYDAILFTGKAGKLPGFRRVEVLDLGSLREAVVKGEAGGLDLGGVFGSLPEGEAMRPLSALDDTTRALDYFLGAPKSEEAQRTLIRRYEGEVTADLSLYKAEADGLRSRATATGLKFANKPTRDVPPIVQALDYEGSIDDAVRALNLTPEEEGLARELRRVMDAESALLKRDVPNFSFREFYWPHELTVPPKPLRTFRGRPVGAKPGFTKARRLQGTLVEKLEQRPDLALYTDDPVAMLERRVYQGTLYRQQFVLIDQMKRVGLAVRKSQLVPEAAGTWRTPKDVLAFNPRPVPGKPELFTEPWVVPNEIASAIEDNFGVSAFSSTISLKVLRDTVAGLKFVKTFGGLFQHIDYAMRTLAAATQYRDISMVATIPKAFGRGFVPGLDAKMLAWEAKSMDAGAVARRALLKHGINTQAGLAFMGREYEAMAREFFLYRTPFIGKAIKAFGSGTFVNAHREYMLDIGQKMVAGYRRGGMSLDEAAAKVALDMNERFSSLPAWQSVFRSPTHRDVMRTAFFSMAEQESWIRMPFRQKAFFASILVNTIALSNMVNLITTGKLLPPEAYVPFVKNPESLTKFSYNVRFLRPELPWKGPDGRLQYLDLLGQADTPLRMIGDPEMAAASRLGQLPSAIGQMVAGETAFGGEPLEDLGEIGGFIAEQISPIPSAGFWGEQKRIGWTGAIIQATGLNVSAERLRDLRNRTAQEEAGKSYDEMTRQEKKDWRAKHPEQFITSGELPEGTPAQQAVALSEKRTTRMAALGVQLENGEIDGGQYREGRGTILQEIAAQRSDIPPAGYKPSTDEEKALDVYYRALDERRAASATGLLASEDFDAADRAVLEELGETGQKALISALTASGDRVEKQYLMGRQVVTDSYWWELQDMIWQAAAKERGVASADMTYQQVIDSVENALIQSGIEPTPSLVERTLRDRGWGPTLDAIETGRVQFRVNHPEVDAQLLRWRFSGVTTVRSEAAIENFRRLTGRDAKPAATGLFKFSDGRVVDGLGSWCDTNDHQVCRLLSP